MFCFPFSSEHFSPETMRQRKLAWLKMVRDSLETRLAAVNAAITTIERQAQQNAE